MGWGETSMWFVSVPLLYLPVATATVIAQLLSPVPLRYIILNFLQGSWYSSEALEELDGLFSLCTEHTALKTQPVYFPSKQQVCAPPVQLSPRFAVKIETNAPPLTRWFSTNQNNIEWGIRKEGREDGEGAA